MTRKRILFLTNPNAGMNNQKESPFRIIEELTLKGCEVTCYPILPNKGIGTEEILSEEPERFDCIVINGGDGTLNHIISYMMKHDIRIPIGYIPGGTTNDFSKSFGEAQLLKDKCENIVNGKTFAFDVGSFNDKYFNYIAAFGAFTWTSYTTSREAKALLGYTAYVLNGIGTLTDSLTYRRHLIIEHDGETIEGDYIYGGISNAESVGGMRFPFISDAALNDGLFEVILISAPDTPRDLGSTVADIVKGRQDGVYVTAFRTNHLTIHCDEGVEWTLDGEEGGSWNDVSMRVNHQAMKIMVSSDFEKNI